MTFRIICLAPKVFSYEKNLTSVAQLLIGLFFTYHFLPVFDHALQQSNPLRSFKTRARLFSLSYRKRKFIASVNEDIIRFFSSSLLHFKAQNQIYFGKFCKKIVGSFQREIYKSFCVGNKLRNAKIGNGRMGYALEHTSLKLLTRMCNYEKEGLNNFFC
jgi:hypothetical protein